MRSEVTRVTMLLALSGLICLAGCGDGGSGSFSISYERPAEIEIPAKVKNLAIHPFDATADSQRWGQVAADKLLDELKTANEGHGRYSLVNPQALKAILDTQDMATAFGNADQAAKNRGKLKNVDAIIYGNIKVSTEERQLERTKPDLRSGRLVSEPYTKYTCVVTVSFNMVDVVTGQTLGTLAPTTLDYDSDRDSKKSALMKMIDTSDDRPATDIIVNDLIDRGVKAFVAKISPHRVTVPEKLASGKSKAVKTGNKLATDKDYDAALEQYNIAIDENSDDHGAMFNAGLMYEAKGDLANAQKMYAKAVSLSDDARYGKALSRVKRHQQADSEEKS